MIAKNKEVLCISCISSILSRDWVEASRLVSDVTDFSISCVGGKTILHATGHLCKNESGPSALQTEFARLVVNHPAFDRRSLARTIQSARQYAIEQRNFAVAEILTND